MPAFAIESVIIFRYQSSFLSSNGTLYSGLYTAISPMWFSLGYSGARNRKGSAQIEDWESMILVACIGNHNVLTVGERNVPAEELLDKLGLWGCYFNY